MAIKKAIDKLHEVIGGSKGSFSDNSGSWVSIEDEHFEICFSFDGSGKKYQGVRVCEKIYQVVDQKTIAQIKNKS